MQQAWKQTPNNQLISFTLHYIRQMTLCYAEILVYVYNVWKYTSGWNIYNLALFNLLHMPQYCELCPTETHLTIAIW